MTRLLPVFLLLACAVDTHPPGALDDGFVPRAQPCRSYVLPDVHSEWACPHRDHTAYPADGGTACLCPVQPLPRDVKCCDLTGCAREALCPGYDDDGGAPAQ